MKYKVYIVPHTHFDAEVFLNRETTLQIGFSNLQVALHLFKCDPDVTFALDQVCYVEPYLRRHPEERLFFLEMVEQGRLEITGGMYTMPDLNIPSGESFIRQVVHGRKYFEKELGVDVKAGWTLDSFGHHPQVPQLMAGSGFDYAIFQRLMRKNGPSEFLFKGIDGSKLPCHWMPASYAAIYGAPSNLHEFTAFLEPRLRYLAAHAQTEHILVLTGADLTAPEESLSEMVRQFNASQDIFELAFASSKDFFSAIDWNDAIPVVEDDLNPVFQGCYSARIEVKQRNRELETLLLDWEKVDAIGQLVGIGFGTDRRDEAWEKVLFNQFHDIICGSHVDEVFYATLGRYEQARSVAEPGVEHKVREIASLIDTGGEGIPVVVYNTLGWERDDAVECSVVFSEPDVYEIEVRNSSGELVPSDLIHPERFTSGGIKKTDVIFVAKHMPAFGYEVFRILPDSEERAKSDIRTSHPLNLREDKSEGYLENSFYHLRFDLWTGVITSLFDMRSDREMLSNTRPTGNTVVKEQDFGNFWQYNGPCKGDAFHPFNDRYPCPEESNNRADFAHNYLGDGRITTGNAYAEFMISHPFASGHFSTRVRIYAGINRVDITTHVLNNDERVRYRAAFPTSIENGTIAHEIPFGAISRPEGEFPAQNWIDYSDDRGGMTLMNRGLPGNNVVDGVMLLSLLKCTALKEGYGETGGFKFGVPTERGYERGVDHCFEYAVMSHAGDWRSGGSYRSAAEYNTRLIAINASSKKGDLPARRSFIACSERNIVLSCVKPLADGIIVRVYEAEGRPVPNASLRFDFEAATVEEINLIGGDGKQVQWDRSKGLLHFAISAFEIKTFKIYST